MRSGGLPSLGSHRVGQMRLSSSSKIRRAALDLCPVVCVGRTGIPGARSYIVEVILDHLSAEGPASSPHLLRGQGQE